MDEEMRHDTKLEREARIDTLVFQLAEAVEIIKEGKMCNYECKLKGSPYCAKECENRHWYDRAKTFLKEFEK